MENVKTRNSYQNKTFKIARMVSVLNKEEDNLLQSKMGNESDGHSSHSEHAIDITEADEGSFGWANSIAQVLKSNKPKTKKTLVLSRAKKANRIKKERKPYDFEIEGEIVEEKPDKTTIDQSIENNRKKNIPLNLRIKPSPNDQEREKLLRNIALKGVVQLFNAVQAQQKEIDKQLKEAGPLDHRKDAVLNNINKKKFLDVLMSGKRAQSQSVDNPIKKEELKSEDESDDDDDKKTKPQWNVLRDDFMIGKKMQNWDMEDDNNSNENHSDSDSNSE